MTRALPVLVAIAASSCLSQELTTTDAMAILRNSPWSYEVKTSFSLSSPRKQTSNRPTGSTPSTSWDDRSLARTGLASFTVTWESARPVLLARKALRQPTMATPYTISVTGIPRALGTVPGFHPRTIQDQATLKSGRRTIKATSADLIPIGNTFTLILQFPTELTITPDDAEVRFRCFILTSEIAVKFQPAKMTHEGRLNL